MSLLNAFSPKKAEVCCYCVLIAADKMFISICQILYTIGAAGYYFHEKWEYINLYFTDGSA